MAKGASAGKSARNDANAGLKGLNGGLFNYRMALGTRGLPLRRYNHMRFKIEGWVQITVSIRNLYVEADSPEEACKSIIADAESYDTSNLITSVNNSSLTAEPIGE